MHKRELAKDYTWTWEFVGAVRPDFGPIPKLHTHFIEMKCESKKSKYIFFQSIFDTDSKLRAYGNLSPKNSVHFYTTGVLPHFSVQNCHFSVRFQTHREPFSPA